MFAVRACFLGLALFIFRFLFVSSDSRFFVFTISEFGSGFGVCVIGLVLFSRLGIRIWWKCCF